MQHFCSGSSNLYLNLHRIDPDDTGQSGVVWKGTVSVPGLGFYQVERYFYPTMGRNMGKNGRNTFLPGRNGRNMVEMVETSSTYISSRINK